VTEVCTFTVAGNFAYSDPNTNEDTFRGTTTSTTTTPPAQGAAVTSRLRGP
jgi:hypothetical protein